MSCTLNWHGASKTRCGEKKLIYTFFFDLGSPLSFIFLLTLTRGFQKVSAFLYFGWKRWGGRRFANGIKREGDHVEKWRDLFFKFLIKRGKSAENFLKNPRIYCFTIIYWRIVIFMKLFRLQQPTKFLFHCQNGRNNVIGCCGSRVLPSDTLWFIAGSLYRLHVAAFVSAPAEMVKTFIYVLIFM